MKQKIALIILMLAAAVIFFIALGGILKSARIIKSGVITESTVISRTGGRKGGPANVTVSFHTADGQQFTARAATRQFLLRGDKVRVYYNPAMPQEIDFGDTIAYNKRGVIAGGIMFILGLFLFARIVLRESADRKLIRSGMKITAEFVSVERNEKYRMGDKNPWLIRCRWTDIRINREYNFVSKDFDTDPSPYLEGAKFITIYINAADPGKYFMDTSFMPKKA